MQREVAFSSAWAVIADDMEFAREQLISFIKSITKDYTTVTPEESVDVLIIDRLEGASTISVAQIREVEAFAYNTSSLSPYKFVVIANAHDMNINASNACLKILEDTPGYTYIFLITNNRNALLPTILSRSRIFHMMSGISIPTHDLAKNIQIFIQSILENANHTNKLEIINMVTTNTNSTEESTQLFEIIAHDVIMKKIQATHDKAQIEQHIKKYNDIVKLMRETRESYMDLKHALIML